MAIRFNTQDVAFTLKNKRKVVNWIKEVAKSYQKSVADISIIFVSDSYILELNKRYLSHNYYTDIITFDYSSKNTIEGDIFISIDTVQSNSTKFNSSFNEEILRVIIHGVLHLIGFKDKKQNDAMEMRRKEDIALNFFISTNDK